jgi:hypothetical protein
MGQLPKARWSILLPVVAVLLTTLLLLSAARDPRQHSSLDYMPYGVIASWVLNGPAFFPTPFRSPIDAPFGDRLYSVLIGWLCLGAYLDWKNKHASAPFLASRLVRLGVFGTLTMVLTVLLVSLGHHLLWVEGSPQVMWMILVQTSFHVRWTALCVLFLWLAVILVWCAGNVFRAARLQPAR